MESTSYDTVQDVKKRQGTVTMHIVSIVVALTMALCDALSTQISAAVLLKLSVATLGRVRNL